MQNSNGINYYYTFFSLSSLQHGFFENRGDFQIDKNFYITLTHGEFQGEQNGEIRLDWNTEFKFLGYFEI